jgi:hypothetical protein
MNFCEQLTALLPCNASHYDAIDAMSVEMPFY